MIKNIIFDMGNVLLKFDRNYFLDAVGVKPADRRTLMNNVYLSLEWAKMDRGSMTEEEAAASMCSRLPERLHEQAHLLVDRWDRPILPVPGMAELVRELKYSNSYISAHGLTSLTSADISVPSKYSLPGTRGQYSCCR